MSYKLAVVRSYFEQLDLGAEIADLYYCLYTKGPLTVSALARYSGIERTRVYRLLESLQQNALIEVETYYKTKLLKAAPIQNLQVLFSKKEQQLLHLQQELPRVEQILQENLAKTSGTKIQFYHGQDGAKLILWNETKASTEIVAILYENIQIKTAEKFFERWVARCNDRNLSFRGIVSDAFVHSQDTWYATHSNDRLKNWTPRYINSKAFEINHSTIMYDDVTAYYNWTDNEIFGIEIYNQEIANTQKEFFELLWNQAEDWSEQTR